MSKGNMYGNLLEGFFEAMVALFIFAVVIALILGGGIVALLFWIFS